MKIRPLLLLALLGPSLPAFGAAAEHGKKPNIVFILADDLGFAEVGCNGSDRNQTPNIDALAENGVRFTRFFTAPLCGPSRAMILTGRYPFRTGAVLAEGGTAGALEARRRLGAVLTTLNPAAAHKDEEGDGSGRSLGRGKKKKPSDDRGL